MSDENDLEGVSLKDATRLLEQRAAALRTEAELNAARQEALQILGLTFEKTKQLSELETKIAKDKKEINDAEERFNNLQLQKIQITNELASKEKELDAERKQALQEQLQNIQEQIGEVNELKEGFKQLGTEIEQNEIKLKNLQTVGEKGKDLAGFLGIENLVESSNEMDQVFVAIANGSLSVGDALSEMGFNFAQMFTPINLMANGLKTLNEIFLLNLAAFSNLDAATVDFTKTTGLVGDLRREVTFFGNDLLNVGVSAAEFSKVFSTLTTGVMDFSSATPTVRREVAQTVALLDKMGVSTDLQAENINLLSKAFNTSMTDAAAFNTQLSNLANQLDMPISLITQGFQQARGTLIATAGSSKELSTQFAALAAQSKATGIAVGDLINIAQKFDTFESAAQQVGMLNNVLGGPFLSTLQMVETADPSERLRMIAQALDDAGKSFETMDYREKQMIANAAGLKDVNDLALVMSGNLAMLEVPEMSTEEIVDLKKQMMSFQTIQEKLTNSMMNFVVAMGPVVEGIVAMVDGIAAFANYMTETEERATALRVVLGAIGGAVIGGILVGLVAAVSAASALVSILLPGLGTGITLAALATGAIAGGALAAAMPTTPEDIGYEVDDSIEGPVGSSGFSRTIIGEEGSIKRVNDKDFIITATDASMQAGQALTQASAPVNSSMVEQVRELVNGFLSSMSAKEAASTQVMQSGRSAANPTNIVVVKIGETEIRRIVNSVPIQRELSPILYDSIDDLLNRGDNNI